MSYQGGPTGTVGEHSRPQLLLAAALALLIHVITGLVLLAGDPQEEPKERTVQVQLVEQGAETAPTKSARETETSTQPAAANEQKVVESLPPPSPGTRPNDAIAPLVATQSDKTAQISETPPEPRPQETKTRTNETQAKAREPSAEKSMEPEQAKTVVQQRLAPANRSAAAAPSGTPTTSHPVEPEIHRQKSTRPDLPQMDPYQLILSRHMMRPIKQFLQRESTLKQFNQAVEAGTQPITIELKLLANGAVRRVQLKESSGSEFVDRIAVQSALAASPYPPPPEKERANGFRFRLHLIMSPVYL